MPAYRKQPVKHIRVRFGEETGEWEGTEVVVRSRLEAGDSLSLLPRIDANSPKAVHRKRVIDWGDAWLIDWNIEEPVLGPDGEPVIGPDGEPLWTVMPCDGEHLAQCDPEFYMLLMYLAEQALAPKVIEATTLDPNSPGSSDSGANRGPSSEPESAAPNEPSTPEPEPGAIVTLPARRRN